MAVPCHGCLACMFQAPKACSVLQTHPFVRVCTPWSSHCMPGLRSTKASSGKGAGISSLAGLRTSAGFADILLCLPRMRVDDGGIWDFQVVCNGLWLCAGGDQTGEAVCKRIVSLCKQCCAVCCPGLGTPSIRLLHAPQQLCPYACRGMHSASNCAMPRACPSACRGMHSCGMHAVP